MSEPTQEILRRGQVIAWLEELGIARWATHKMMEEGLIIGVTKEELITGVPRTPLTGKASNNGSNRKGKNKHGGGKKGPRLYYLKSPIKEKLKL